MDILGCAALVAEPMRFLSKIVAPLVYIIRGATNLVLVRVVEPPLQLKGRFYIHVCHHDLCRPGKTP